MARLTNAAAHSGVAIFCHVPIRYRLVSLPALNVPRHNLEPSVLSGLKDSEVLLKRKGRPRGTRRLETSAEIVQKVADRTEKLSTGKHEGSLANIDRHASRQPDAVVDTAQDGDEEVDSEEGSTLG
ncbi:hypothetical protein V1524DRAFT_411386, partial [Lipomyces starkeyi]